MYLYVNDNNEIKSVNTSVFGLTGLYVDETAENFPFANWSEAKICCYRVNVTEGVITMMTPYVDSRLLDHFDQVGLQNEANSTDILSTMDGLADTYESMEKNTTDIDTCLEGIAELYELVIPETTEE